MLLSRKDLLIMSHLRQNGRISLTELSKRTKIPVSTIFDKLKQHQGDFIKRHTSLIDFSKIGFNTRVNFMLKIDRDKRDGLREYLLKNFNVNSVFKINTTHDFLVDCVFRNMKEMEEWQEELEDSFKIRSKVAHFVVDEVKKEEFLSQPEFLDMVVGT